MWYRSTLALSSDVNYGVVWYAWRMAHAMHIGSVKFLFFLLLSSFFLVLGFRGRGVLCYVRYDVRECF